MIVARSIHGRHGRHAVTLMELLLVLCLLVVLASLSWPALDRPLATHQLRKAADYVRVEWGRARIGAMSTGAIYAFRYALDGDCYTVQRVYGTEYMPATSTDGELDYDDPAASEPKEQTLPEGITFAAGETAEDTRTLLSQSYMDTSSVDEGDRCDPIMFFPDGTTSTATLVLKNQHDRCIDVTIRGLTGVATVGKPYSSDEITQ